VKSVPRGKAIWNANGGVVSVLLTHLLLLLLPIVGHTGYRFLPHNAAYCVETAKDKAITAMECQ